jgi:hypothetical protein
LAVRVRLISKKPGVPATSSVPSHSRPAASPLGAGVTTGPKNATGVPFGPGTWITGVPTSSPTGAMPVSWLARTATSSVASSAASASAGSSPASSSADANNSRPSSSLRTWIRVPRAV